MDKAIVDFIEFVENMQNSIVELEQENSAFHTINLKTLKLEQENAFHTMNLKTLIKNIKEYETFSEWWKSKNLTNHFNKVLIKTILKTNPPESVKHALVFIML